VSTQEFFVHQHVNFTTLKRNCFFFGKFGPLYNIKANVQLKSGIPIDATVEISPQVLYPRSQG
jgi:hypothetical protein